MEGAADLLHHILKEVTIGNAVTLIPMHAELTTRKAADLLNVSSPFLVRLQEEEKIKHHKFGPHRRIKFKELEAYR
jgi:excisionase family DNA binding protein